MSLNEYHDRLHQSVEHIHRQTSKQDCVGLRRLLGVTDRLISDHRKQLAKHEGTHAKRLVVQLDRDLFASMSEHSRVNRPQEHELDIEAIVAHFASVRQSILRHWFTARLRNTSGQRHANVSTAISADHQYHTLTKSTSQLDNQSFHPAQHTSSMNESCSQTISQSCSASSHQLPGQSTDRPAARGLPSGLYFHQLFEEDMFVVDEPAALTWTDLISRMRSIPLKLIIPIVPITERSQRGSAPQSNSIQFSVELSSGGKADHRNVDHFEAHAVAQDLYSLSVSSSVRQLQLEKVDRSIVMQYSTHLSRKIVVSAQASFARFCQHKREKSKI